MDSIRYWYQLRNAIGQANAQRLIETDGGRVFYLARASHGALTRRLAEICGEDVAEACRRRFDGHEMRIPTGLRHARKKVIFDGLDAVDSGRITIPELSRMTGITDDCFYYYQRKLKALA